MAGTTGRSAARRGRRAAITLAVAVALVVGTAGAGVAGMGFQQAVGNGTPIDGSFNQTAGIAVDATGEVFIGDNGNNRVQRFDTSGTFSTKWGSAGSSTGQFSAPTSVAAPLTAGVFVADAGNNRIQKFTGGGTFITSWGTAGTGSGQFQGNFEVAANATETLVYTSEASTNRVQEFSGTGTFVGTWGGTGSGDGQFNGPTGIAVDSGGNVWVADTNNQRIQEFSSTGTFMAKFGSLGTGNGQFESPSGVAVDTSGNIYVADTVNNRVQKFDNTTAFVTTWGTAGVGDNQLEQPRDIAVDSSANVYVSDVMNFVRKFSSTGTFSARWGGPNGKGPGQFAYPSAVALDGSGNQYVTDPLVDRVQKFDPTMTLSTQWGTPGSGNGQFSGPNGIAVSPDNTKVYVADQNRVQYFDTSGTFTSQWGSQGSGNGQFQGAQAVAVDRNDGSVYVADVGNDRVQKFSATGTYIMQWGSMGSANGSFDQPRGLAVDSTGAVYVVDANNYRVQKFTVSGAVATFVTKWGSVGSGDGQLLFPTSIGVDGLDRLYVTDLTARVQKFNSAGKFMSKFGSAGSGNGQFGAAAGIAFNLTTEQGYVADGSNHRIQRFGQAAGLTPIPPTRILDTRFGTGAPMGPIPPNGTLDLTVVNTFGSGVPATGVDSVILNVAATDTAHNGWLTIFPSGAPLPTASNLNFSAGQTVPNLVVVKVGRGGVHDGKVSIANTAFPTGPPPAAGTVDVVADIVGWYADGSDQAAVSAGAGFVGTSPTRIVDTRFGNGAGCPTCLPIQGAVGPNGSIVVDAASVAPLLGTGATAAVLNVAVTQPTQNGWLTVFPDDQPLPTASNLNFVAGQTVPNLVTVKLGVGGGHAGKVDIANTAFPTGPPPASGTVHVVADVVGYYKPGFAGTALLDSFAPQRILDTRFGTGGVTGPVGPNATITVDPQTATGVAQPGGYTGVIVNVAVTQPTQNGWLTVYPSDGSLPTASNLNFVAGETVPNLVKIKVGPDGKFKISNTGFPTGPPPAAGTVQIVADIVGYYE
jgi:tripartite motif-containing protein 71